MFEIEKNYIRWNKKKNTIQNQLFVVKPTITKFYKNQGTVDKSKKQFKVIRYYHNSPIVLYVIVVKIYA